MTANDNDDDARLVADLLRRVLLARCWFAVLLIATGHHDEADREIIATSLVLKDEGSRNGVYVDKVKVVAMELTAGDVFEVGATRLLAMSSRMQLLRAALLPLLGGEPVGRRDRWPRRRRGEAPRLVLCADGETLPWRIARLIHQHGPMRDRPCVAAAEVPADVRDQRALLDQAEHGTLVVPLAAIPAGSLLATELVHATRAMRWVVLTTSTEGASSLLGTGRLERAASAFVPPLATHPADTLPLISALVAEHAV